MLIRKALNHKLCFSVTKIITFTLLDIILASSQFFFDALLLICRNCWRIPSAAVGHSFAASARKHVLISNCSCSRNANIDIPWQRMAWPTKADLYCYTHTLQSHEEERLEPSSVADSRTQVGYVEVLSEFSVECSRIGDTLKTESLPSMTPKLVWSVSLTFQRRLQSPGIR